MSADLPAGAVTAAADAVAKIHDKWYHSSPPVNRACAEAALEAAAPAVAERAAADERARWAAKLREMAAAVLPQISTTGSVVDVLAALDRNSPGQAEGRLLLQLADLLEGCPDER